MRQVSNKATAEQKEHIGVVAICLATYFACEPLTFITAFGGMSFLKLATMPILAVLLVAMFVSSSKHGIKPIRFNGVHLLALIYLMYSTTTLFYYKNETATTQLKDLYLAYLVLILATCRPLNKRETKLISIAWLFVGVVCMMLVLNSNETIYGDRTVIIINGSYEDPNQFCAYFVMPILTALSILLNANRPLKKVLSLVYVGVLFFTILKTGSRGGLMGVGVAVFVYLFFATKGVIKKIAMVCGMALIAVMMFTVLMPYMPEGVQKRMSLEAVENDKGSGRFTIWQFLVNYTLNGDFKTMLFGHGLLSTYEIMHENFFTNGVAHNQTIQILFDQGILGLCTFVPLVLTALLRTIKKNKVAFAALCSIIVFSMSLTFYTFKPMINILMMCALQTSSDL